MPEPALQTSLATRYRITRRSCRRSAPVPRTLARRVNVLDVYGLGAFISLADFKFHIVTFLERTWGFALVNEYVLASIGRSDESEALS